MLTYRPQMNSPNRWQTCCADEGYPWSKADDGGPLDGSPEPHAMWTLLEAFQQDPGYPPQANLARSVWDVV